MKYLLSFLFLFTLSSSPVFASYSSPATNPFIVSSLSESFTISNSDTDPHGWLLIGKEPTDSWICGDSFYSGGDYGTHTLEDWLNLCGRSWDSGATEFHLLNVTNGQCRTGNLEDCLGSGYYWGENIKICIGTCPAEPDPPVITPSTTATFAENNILLMLSLIGFGLSFWLAKSLS